MSPTVSPAALDLARPALLWGLALAIPIVLLHLHHRRRVVVPFLGLVEEAAGRPRPAGGWRRLRDLLALLARLGALVLLVLALAGLRPAEASPPPPSLVVVVDADVTTRVREAGDRSRFEQSLDLARAFLVARPWRTAAVVAAAEVPTVWQSPSDDLAHVLRRHDRRRADAAAGRLEPAPSAGDLDAAVAVAYEQAAARTPARVVVLSARPLDVPDAPPGVEVVVAGTGTASGDQGLVAFDLATTAGVRRRLVVGVRNDAPQAAGRELVVRSGGEEVARRPLALGGGEETIVEVEVMPPREGGWLEARLEGEDAFDRNDAAVAWLAPPTRPSVLVVHDGGVRPWLAATLDALGEAIDAPRSGLVAAADLARAPPADVIVVDGAAVPAGALRPGAWLFLAPLAGELPFRVEGAVEDPLVWRTDADHPLVRDLDLATPYVARGQTVAGPGLVGLAEADGGVVLAEGERAGVRYVVLGLDAARSDLPLRAALPLLVRGALRRLAAAPAEALPPFLRPGDAVRPQKPLPGGPAATLAWSGGRLEGRASPSGRAMVVPAGASGRAWVETRGGGDAPGVRLPVGLVDLEPARTVRPARPLAAPPPAAPSGPDLGLRWRRALLAGAVLLLLLDLLALLGGRRHRPRLAGPQRRA